MPEPKEQNELAGEISPYLLQHADNPVKWMPWGEKAFAKARSEEKLILLSIGYSTCHWCHVMAEESFENDEIAAFLNEHFICIKVDREERPDVDLTYMTFVQMSSGQGGWPLNVFLTPGLKPVYGGTYWPPKDMPGRAGFPRVCREVLRSWNEERESIITRSDSIVEKLNQAFAPDSIPADAEALGPDFLPVVMDYFGGQFDHHYGGFGGSPKFPRPNGLLLLLRLHRRFAGQDEGRAHFSLDMALTTLRAMTRGGIHDQIGGDFHRYAVDEIWHVPHFEKMLYDQALLAQCFVSAHCLTGLAEFRSTAEGIFTALLRDFRLPGGAFASAEDADSYVDSRLQEKAEGAFYVWGAAEIEKILGPEDGPVFRFTYGVRKDGNVSEHHDPQGHFRGKNILFRARSTAAAAEQFEKTPEEIEAALQRGREKLLEARALRPRPHLDDKVLTAWNALAISAFAKAAAPLENPLLLETAGEALAFVRKELWPDKKRLLRSWRGEAADIAAFSIDYALLIQAMLDHYEATFSLESLQDAVLLQQQMDELYLDREHGGYFSVVADRNHAVFSMKEETDGAEPSPNSIAAINLLRLGKMLARNDFLDQAEKLFRAFTPHLRESAYSSPALVEALEFSLNPTRQVVIAAPDAQAATMLADVVRRAPQTGAVLLLADSGPAAEWLGKENPAIQGMSPVHGNPAAFVCQNFACQAPVTHPGELARIFEGQKASKASKSP